MLTNVALNALKPGGKAYKKSDSGGLFILVETNGSKLWRFAYRYDGKHKLLSGGRFPQTTLLAARAWRDKMKHQLALGLDPSEERRKEAAVVPAGDGSSFEAVAREWLQIRMVRSEEQPSELQSLMSISYAVFCLKKNNKQIRR